MHYKPVFLLPDNPELYAKHAPSCAMVWPCEKKKSAKISSAKITAESDSSKAALEIKMINYNIECGKLCTKVFIGR